LLVFGGDAVALGRPTHRGGARPSWVTDEGDRHRDVPIGAAHLASMLQLEIRHTGEKQPPRLVARPVAVSLGCNDLSGLDEAVEQSPLKVRGDPRRGSRGATRLKVTPGPRELGGPPATRPRAPPCGAGLGVHCGLPRFPQGWIRAVYVIPVPHQLSLTICLMRARFFWGARPETPPTSRRLGCRK
jgi:hypothetical protein